jgi:hypothetical protein
MPNIFDYYYQCWVFWMQMLYDIKAIENNANVQRERVDRLEEIIYGGYV